MDFSQRRKEFSIFVIDADFAHARALAETLQGAGYAETRFFPTVESALTVARDLPPHVVLLAADVGGDKADQAAEAFLLELRSISSEILAIPMISNRQILSALQMVGRGLAFDYVARPLVSTLELVQKIDRACARLYYQFESEQLREHYAGAGAGSVMGEKDYEPPIGDFLGEAIERLAQAKEIDQCVQSFMEILSRGANDAPTLYFRYVPSHMSLLVSQAVWLPIEKFRGVGLDLKSVSGADFSEFFREPVRLPGFVELITQVFRRTRFTAFTHFHDQDVVGIFVVLDAVDVDTPGSGLAALRTVFDVAYRRNVAMKEKHALDTADAVTGLFNRRHFAKCLEEEIVRSRRILLPVSLITLRIDGFRRLHEELGFQQVDALLRMLGAILKKTTRLNDIIARTNSDEVNLVLPHTAYMGAAVKAERVRRVVEGTKFPVLEARGVGSLTVSCGVSEYPSFSSDAESLIRTADEALNQVRELGGNRVCVATPPDGFKIDFAPQVVPSWPGMVKGAVKT